MIEQSNRPVTAGGGNYNPRQGNNNIYNQSNNGQLYESSNQQQDIDSQMMFQQYEQPLNFGQRTGSAKSFKPTYQSKIGIKPKGIRAQTAQQQNRILQQIEPGKKGIPLQQQADLFKRNQDLFDKEKLFEDLQHAKGIINQINEENQRLKTKNVNLDREINKQSKLIDELQHAGQNGKKSGKFQNDTFLITSLKRQVKDLQQEVSYKTQEIDKLKKNIKYTKFSEIEIEKKAFADETLRLRRISEQLLQENGQFENQEEKIMELEERCLFLNNLIETLRKDNTEMANAIRNLEEKSINDQQQSKKQEQKLKDQKRQIANFKKQLNEKDEQIRSLRNIQLYQQQNTQSGNRNKRPLNTQNQTQQQNEQKIYKQHQNQLETQQNHQQGKQNQPPQNHLIHKQEQNIKQQEQSQKQTADQLQQQQQLQEEQSQQQDNYQHETQAQQLNQVDEEQEEQEVQQEQEQQQDLEQQKQEEEEKPQEIYNSPVKQEDISYFTYYVKIKLQLNDFASTEIKSHLQANLPKDCIKYTRINIAQLKSYFSEHPYQLEECEGLEFYCRYLVEPTDQDSILYDENKYANLSLVQNRIYKDFYSKPQTNDDKNKNFEYIQYILKNKMELVKTCIEQVSGQKDWFSYSDLKEAFQKASITFNQEQIDYILVKIINFNDQKQNEDCLKNLKINDLFAAFSVQMERPSRNKRPISSRGRRTSEQGPKGLINNQSPQNKNQIQKEDINDYLNDDEKIEDDDGDYDDDFDYYGENRLEAKPRILNSGQNTQDLKKPSNITQSNQSQNYGDEDFESEDNIKKQESYQNNNKKSSSLSNRIKQKASSRNQQQQSNDYQEDYEQEEDENYGDDFEDENNNTKNRSHQQKDDLLAKDADINEIKNNQADNDLSRDLVQNDNVGDVSNGNEYY